MATNYPGSLDTSTQQPSPSASTEMDDSGFEHDAVHTNHSGAIIALETKVGTGDSNAVANSVLAGTGSGTSAWTTGALANDISGNAATATALETARTINGTSFNGTANITVTAAAGTLTGGTLNSGVTASSLTSVGTLTSLTTSGDITGTSDTNFFVKNDSGEEILFQESSNSIFIKTNGTYRAKFASNGDFVPYADGTYDLGTSSATWQHAYLNFVHVDEVRGSNGSASDPAFTFTSDGDTGMYRYTTNQVALTGGNTVCLIAASGTVNTAGLSTSTTSGYQYVLRNTTFGTLYRYTSSTDVKENITNVTASDAGAWMDALQPVTFNERWLQEGTESDEDRAFREADIQVGFVADDVLANSTIAKFAQVEDVDGTLKGVGWKWECVIAAAVAEIKSLRTRVADLEAA